MNVVIGDTVRALKDGSFPWGLTMQAGDMFAVTNARDIALLDWAGADEYFEIVRD